MSLKFRYVRPGDWSAVSPRYPDLVWRIGVSEDGEFIVSESDSFLTSTCWVLPTFNTFSAARLWIVRMESPIKAIN